MSSQETGKPSWSPWLDFDNTNITTIPESAGVFMMHAAMKILFIGSGQNLRQSLFESLSVPCIEKAKRFRYMIIESHDKMKENLIKEYLEKHEGKLPLCMVKSGLSN